ncbi:hypothetical protein [Flavobacterium limi]|uniref:Cupin domain-containing protein n=1 Tax=Flavobacterium limi TaxID=2045105 RepID=A0ABQ1UP21_9FLAO|nr:hypothetical protein [Flavobacterium limi]GGF22704.1 hypothetical protein GCM10011518_34930 [Flavobacterium limi]
MKKNVLRTLFAFTSILLLSNSIVAQERSITLANEMKWIPMLKEMGDKGPVFSVVFGNLADIGKPICVMVKIPAGTTSPLHTHSSSYWAVMIEGNESAYVGDVKNVKPIPPGSTWFEPGKNPHCNKCFEGKDCLFFVYYDKGMDMQLLKEIKH